MKSRPLACSLFAASALLGSLLSPCAQAAVSNGISLNGISLNGVSLQGVRLNGISLQGIRLNGVTLQGIRFNGITLQGVRLNGAGNGSAEFHATQGEIGAVAVTLADGRKLALR